MVGRKRVEIIKKKSGNWSLCWLAMFFLLFVSLVIYCVTSSSYYFYNLHRKNTSTNLKENIMKKYWLIKSFSKIFLSFCLSIFLFFCFSFLFSFLLSFYVFCVFVFLFISFFFIAVFLSFCIIYLKFNVYILNYLNILFSAYTISSSSGLLLEFVFSFFVASKHRVFHLSRA